MKIFDRKFLTTFESLPDSPGVYLFMDGDETVYVGKSKSLKQRLGQYRNANRTKRDRKKWQIIKAADRLEFRLATSEEAALLLENELIQRLRPQFNVEGAFSFMYPAFGLKRCDKGDLWIAYSTKPEALAGAGYDCFGSFRSRWMAREAFQSLRTLFSLIGNRERTPRQATLPYTAQSGFRQIPAATDDAIREFFVGVDMRLLTEISMRLLENPESRL